MTRAKFQSASYGRDAKGKMELIVTLRERVTRNKSRVFSASLTTSDARVLLDTILATHELKLVRR